MSMNLAIPDDLRKARRGPFALSLTQQARVTTSGCSEEREESTMSGREHTNADFDSQQNIKR